MSVFVSPQMQTIRVTIDVVFLGRMKLDYDLIIVPKGVFDE